MKAYKSEILLAQPQGLCAGVKRAIEIVERVLMQFGAPIYIRHEIVHNTYVVNTLRNKGAIFIEKLTDVPEKNIVIFSAHGVSKAVVEEAHARNLIIFDATCPLVTKVHKEVINMRNAGREIIMIGHKGHPEVEGTMGQIKEKIYLVETIEDVLTLKVHNSNMLAYVTQTTLSMNDAYNIINALKYRFPTILEPKKNDICYATTNRQKAVKFMASQVQIIIVVGSLNSSNSNRLKETAESKGIPTYLVDNASQINLTWIIDKKYIGITAGASVPKILVEEVINKLQYFDCKNVRILNGLKERTVFPIPKNLRLLNIEKNIKSNIFNVLLKD